MRKLVVRNRRAGVTLLETLLALVVMALLAMISTTLLGFSSKSLGRTEANGRYADIALGRNELRSWVERAITTTLGSPTLQSLHGYSNQMTFVTLLDDGRFWPGAPTAVELSNSGEASGRVVSASARGAVEGGKDDVVTVLNLSQAGGKLDLSYFGLRADEAEAVWHDTWNQADGLPLLVRVMIADGGMTYPPLIIRPGREFHERTLTLRTVLPDAPR